MNATGYSLYHILDGDNKVAYVGISNNPDVRALQHEASGRLGEGYRLQSIENDLTYGKARGFEQADIDFYGTRDSSRIGIKGFEPGEPNRINSFNINRTGDRADEFNKWREHRLKIKSK